MYPSAAQVRNGVRAALLAAVAATASAQDDGAAVRIEADRAELTRDDGKSTYLGNVVLSRGGLELRGDRLVVERGEDNTVRAVLHGAPARVEAAPEESARIRGRADEIVYDSADETVVLSGDAHVERGGDTVSGMTIRHNLATARTEAARGDSERVRITIQPKSAGSGGVEPDDR